MPEEIGERRRAIAIARGRVGRRGAGDEGRISSRRDSDKIQELTSDRGARDSDSNDERTALPAIAERRKSAD